MATVIKRQIRATPHRTASETWKTITDLIAPDEESSARSELSLVAGILEQVIASESTKDCPIVVHGNGPRLRLYCLYDDDAISGEDSNENSLPFTAAEGDWHMSIPCLEDDLQWVADELKRHSKRISAREIGSEIEDEGEEIEDRTSDTTVDQKSFLRS